MSVRAKGSAVAASLLAAAACGCGTAASIGLEPPKPQPLEVAAIVGCTGSEAEMRAPGQLFEKAALQVARRTAEQSGTFSLACVGRNPKGSAAFAVEHEPFASRYNTPSRRQDDLNDQADKLRPDILKALRRTAKEWGSRVDQMLKLGAEEVATGNGRRVVVIISDGMSTDGRPGRFHAYRHPPMTTAQVQAAVQKVKDDGELPDLHSGSRPIEVYFLGVRDGRNVLDPDGTAAVDAFLAGLVHTAGGTLRTISPGIDLRTFGGSATPAKTTTKEDR
jgi:hypothetical protein